LLSVTAATAGPAVGSVITTVAEAVLTCPPLVAVNV
jgi:hypothetical protein